jgi:hypothetical protein
MGATRRHRIPRPIAVLVAVFLGLGGLGAAAGAALGAVGGESASAPFAGHHHHDDGPGFPPGR